MSWVVEQSENTSAVNVNGNTITCTSDGYYGSPINVMYKDPVDRNGQYVVVELKLSQGRNKALGQLLYYMGWVDQNLGHRPCRGLIIASDISDELSIAVSRAAGVRLAKYRMTFSIELIGSPTSLNSDK